MNDKESLKKLWTNRFKVLMEADKLLGTDKFSAVAYAYLQCAEELEKPPVDLFEKLEYNDTTPDIDPKELERLVKIKEKMEEDNAQAIPPKPAQFKPYNIPLCDCRPGEVCVQCSVHPVKIRR